MGVNNTTKVANTIDVISFKVGIFWICAKVNSQLSTRIVFKEGEQKHILSEYHQSVYFTYSYCDVNCPVQLNQVDS